MGPGRTCGRGRAQGQRGYRPLGQGSEGVCRQGRHARSLHASHSCPTAPLTCCNSWPRTSSDPVCAHIPRGFLFLPPVVWVFTPCPSSAVILGIGPEGPDDLQVGHFLTVCTAVMRMKEPGSALNICIFTVAAQHLLTLDAAGYC